jgi:hypothetical protein
MNQLLSLLLFLATAPWRVSAAIGPGANLEIVNAQIAPDGLKRPFVPHLFKFFLCGLTFYQQS